MNLVDVVTLEEIRTSGFYLLLLCIYSAFVECRQKWAYLPLRVPVRHRVAKTQPCIQRGPLGKTTLRFISNLPESCYLASLKSRL